VVETELMPNFVGGYTEAVCSKLKSCNRFLKPNFERGPKLRQVRLYQFSKNSTGRVYEELLLERGRAVAASELIGIVSYLTFNLPVPARLLRTQEFNGGPFLRTFRKVSLHQDSSQVESKLPLSFTSPKLDSTVMLLPCATELFPEK
jgi:hypothetical protein